ncbi:hypothetical protein D3C87_1711280 [compost metagenome]
MSAKKHKHVWTYFKRVVKALSLCPKCPSIKTLRPVACHVMGNYDNFAACVGQTQILCPVSHILTICVKGVIFDVNHHKVNSTSTKEIVMAIVVCTIISLPIIIKRRSIKVCHSKFSVVFTCSTVDRMSPICIRI